MSLRRKILQGGTWATIGFIICTFIQIIVNISLVRLLPPPVLGDYYLLVNIVSLLVILASLGLPQALVKLIPACISNSKYDLAKQYFYISVRISIISSLVVSVVFYILFSQMHTWVFHSSFSFGLTTLILTWFFFIVFQGILSATLRSFHDLKSVVILSDILPKMLLLTGLFLLWIKNYNDIFLYLLSILTCVSFVSVITLIMRLQLHFKKDKKITKNDKEQSIVKLAFPLWITTVMLYLLTAGDIWIIGIFLSTSNVAVYGSVLKLIFFLSIIFNLLNTVVTPIISELFHKQDFEKLESLLRITATLSGIPALIISLLFFLYGELILNLIFGEFYTAGLFVLQVLSIGVTINILTGSCGTVLMYTNNQKLMMNITIASGSFTIISSLFLVNLYGIDGVAIASSLGMVLQNILMFISVRLKLGIWTHFSLSHLKKIGMLDDANKFKA